MQVLPRSRSGQIAKLGQRSGAPPTGRSDETHLDRVMTGHTDITIRAWQRRDLEQVQALLTLLSDDAVVRSEDAPTYVAETDGRVVGMVTLCVFRTLTGPKAYVDHLVVAPGRRRRGIGRALVQHAIERAAAMGASRIDLTANTEKAAGRALYQSLGFQERDTGTFRLLLAAPLTVKRR
jgi:ribosomal protein S18 acetylase RimI-like enzyme